MKYRTYTYRCTSQYVNGITNAWCARTVQYIMQATGFPLIRPFYQYALQKWFRTSCLTGNCIQIRWIAFRYGEFTCNSCFSCLTEITQIADARKRAHRSGLVQFLQSTSSSVVESYICLIQFANCCNHAVRGSVVWTLTPDSTLLVCSSDLLYSCS